MTDADGAFFIGTLTETLIRLSLFVGMQSLEIHTGKLNLDKVHTFKLKPDSKTAGRGGGNRICEN